MLRKAVIIYKKSLRNAWFYLSLLPMVMLGTCIYSFESPTFSRKINEDYYFTHEISGFATTSNVRHINVYQKREWLPDKEIADFDLIDRSGSNDVKITYQSNRLILFIDQKLLLDTLLEEGQSLNMDDDDFVDNNFIIGEK